MLKLIRISFFIASFFVVTAQAQLSPNAVRDSLSLKSMQSYMDTFPESDLRDLYKFMFQGYFGPEHLITDSMGAVNYIRYEMEHADSADWEMPLFYYPTGMLGSYIRVDINYVRKGIVPMENFVSALLRSAAASTQHDRSKTESFDYWKRFWQHYLPQIATLVPRPGNFEADSLAIAQTLEAGQYAVHHSSRYNVAYRQHYRIIRRDIFEKEILPLILRR